MTMTPEAKSQLSTTIRGLRRALLGDDDASGALFHATESAYQMGIPLSSATLSEVPRTRRQRLEQWIAEQARTVTGAAGSAKGSKVSKSTKAGRAGRVGKGQSADDVVAAGAGAGVDGGAISDEVKRRFRREA